MTFQEMGEISVSAYYKGLENQSQFKESVVYDTLVSVEKKHIKGLFGMTHIERRLFHMLPGIVG